MKDETKQVLKSKLSSLDYSALTSKDKVGVVTKKHGKKMSSIRYSQDDWANISTVKAKLNTISKKGITDADVIRACLMLGAKATPEQLIEALRDTI